MKTISVTKARSDFYNLPKEASLSHEFIQITGKQNNAILLAGKDRPEIQETLYLLAIRGCVNL